jgi:PAS domain S-box-containing protein
VTGTRLALLVAAGALLYGGAIAIAATSDQAVGGAVVAAFAAGLSFTATGIVAVARRPENGTGRLMLVVGFVWALGALTLTSSSLLFTVGAITEQLAFAPLAQLLLAYPTGTLERRYERRLVEGLWAVLFVGPLLQVLVDPTPTGCTTCPESAFVVRSSHTAAVTVEIGYAVAAFALVLAVVVELVRKYRANGPPFRRTVSPVYAMFGAAIFFLLLSNALEAVSKPAATTFGVIAVVFIALVPVAFLAGLLRSRLARGSVLQLLTALETGTPLRDALSDALGDPSLELAYWLGEGRWADAEGRALPEPAAGPGRAVTTVERRGEPVAALLHESSLEDEPTLVRGVAAAAALALEAERSQAELRSQYSYLQALVDTMPSLLVTIDLEGGIVGHNGAMLEAAGYDDGDEVVGRPFWDVFIAPEERDDVRARFARDAPDFPLAEYENAFTNARGEERVVFWRIAPVHDDEGRVVSIVAGGIDISDRHRLEAEKEREREFLNAIANRAPSLMCLIDDEGLVTERGVNIAFETTLEWDDADVGGRVLWEHWVDPADADEVRERIARVVAGETLGDHDNLWVTGTGKRLTLAWTCTALPKLDERRLFLIAGNDVTERRQRERDIREAEERLRAVIESSPVAIVEIGLDGNVKLWNPAAERTFGFSPEEVLGHPPLWVPPDREEEFRELSSREALGDGYTGFETVRAHRDGRLLDVEISAAPIRDAGGAVVGAMAVLNDITDRKRQEEALRNERDFLLTVGRATPSLLAVLDANGRVNEELGVNDAFKDLLGYSDELAKGRYVWDLISPMDEAPLLREHVLRSIAEESLVEREDTWVARDGTRLAVAWSCRHLGEIGGAHAYLVCGTDVTEHRVREAQLQRERDITGTLMQAIPSLVVVVDSEAVIVDSGIDETRAGVNNAFRHTLGWPDAAVVHRSVLDLIDAADGDTARAAIASAASGVASAEQESRWLCADGEHLVVAWTATPVADVTGRKASLVLLSGVDVTERKRQEEEVRASRARIVQAADDARRLLERNLHDGAQQRLVALSVSLRLAEAKLSSDLDSASATLSGAREELALALEELRELARGIHPAVLTDRGLSAALEALVARTPLPIEVAAPEQRLPPAVEAALYYVVAESLTNVVKYAAATSAHVRVEVAGTGVVTVEVSDDGIGGADPARGSGLRGLVDRVEALDGRLTVDSPAGGGTRVRAEVPLAAFAAPEAAVPAPGRE